MLRRPALLLILDLVAVLVFAVVGRTSHAEDVAGTLATAVPFAAGAGVGVLVARAWRDPLAWRSGLLVWAGAVVVGLALRVLITGRLPLSFVVVVTVALGVLVLGWRGLARLVAATARRRVPR